jgi:transposase
MKKPAATRQKEKTQIEQLSQAELVEAEQWWYFLNDPSVPPDNNLAERSLRLAVTKRKVSGGSRSMKRFEETANLRACHPNLSFSSSFSNDFFP